MNKKISTVAMAAAVLMASGLVPADEPKSGVEVGVLSCKSLPDTAKNLVIHSTVQVECVYESTSGKENYVGETGIGLGVDLNWKRVDDIGYTVLAGSTDVRPGSGALAGKYVGAKASATVGYGGGAAVLVGGGGKNISLQPLALEGSQGLGVAAGLTYLYIEPAK